MPFAQIQGQQPAIQILQQQILQDATPHAWLFDGPAQVGKSQTAEQLVASINCMELSSGCTKIL